MQKIILYLGGGTMSGIFQLGVLNALENQNCYHCIEKIYAGSVGTINGAYFLTRQTQLGFTVYTENLGKDFILYRNLPQVLWQRIARDKHHQTKNVIDLDYLFDIIENKKPLNTAKLKEQAIPLYVSLLDIDNGKIKYVDARRQPFQTLKAGTCITPYYSKIQIIDGKKFVDGAIKRPIGIDFLLRAYPSHKIVVILNDFLPRRRRHYLKNYLESFFSKRAFGQKISSAWLKRENNLRTELKTAFGSHRITVIYPPSYNPVVPKSTDAEKLTKSYNIGQSAGVKLARFLCP